MLWAILHRYGILLMGGGWLPRWHCCCVRRYLSCTFAFQHLGTVHRWRRRPLSCDSECDVFRFGGAPPAGDPISGTRSTACRSFGQISAGAVADSVAPTCSPNRNYPAPGASLGG